MANLQLFLLILVGLIQINVCTSDESYCPQLGCDAAGTFKQDGFTLPIDGKRNIKWTSKSPSLTGMSEQNENYGCVGSSVLVVCPYFDEVSGYTKHLMLNTDTGTEYDTSQYYTLDNVNMPILTNYNHVVATNGTHVSLVDPINKRSFITELPTVNPQGVHSPLYIPELEFFIILGNLTETHSIYTLYVHLPTGHTILKLLTTFTVERESNPCPWLPMTEMAGRKTRGYFYAYHKDGGTGTIAVDFMDEPPYYKKAWEVADDSDDVTESGKERDDNTDNCTAIPKFDPDIPFPPIDIRVQLLATPDGYIVITTSVGLLNLKDNGSSGEKLTAAMFGTHFLSLETSAAAGGKAPMVWMSGWKQFPKFGEILVGYNYSNTDGIMDHSIWTIEFCTYLGIDGLNVTSRVTTFPAPGGKDKIMVFGVRVNNTKTDSRFQMEYCQDCSLGINTMLMAVRTESKSTVHPYIYWMAQLPSRYMEARGQIIGLSNKIIVYVKQANGGNIIALE